jgi:hypothetical protein
MSETVEGCDDDIPASLRGWFVVDFVFSTLVTGLPLLVLPEPVLSRLGWVAVDPLASRLVGAALVALGWQSWRSRKSGRAVYRALLGLKVIWCSLAIIGSIAAIGAGAPQPTWALLSALLIFDGVWIHHAVRLKRSQPTPAMEEDQPPTTASSRVTAEDGDGIQPRLAARRPTEPDPDEDATTEDLGPVEKRSGPGDGARPMAG